MSRQYALWVTLGALLVACPAAPHAQIPVDYITVAATSETSCHDPPQVCDGVSFLPTPGLFHAFVYAGPEIQRELEAESGGGPCSDGCCRSACLPVHLTVLPPVSVEPTTWGSIKANAR